MEKFGLLVFTAEDGTEIKFDEYVYEPEDGERPAYYWVTVCSKCLKKFGKYFGSDVCDHGSGCCSVCGCDTPDYTDCKTDEERDAWDSRYVDFSADEVKEI